MSSINESFDDIFQELKHDFDCTYLFYLYEYGNQKIALSSNKDWYNLYFKAGLIDHCPLLRLGHQKFNQLKTSKTIVSWDKVQSLTKEEKNVVGIRSEFKICHGISFGHAYANFKEYIGLATDNNNRHFPLLMVMNKPLLLNYMNRLRFVADVGRINNVEPLSAHRQ